MRFYEELQYFSRQPWSSFPAALTTQRRRAPTTATQDWTQVSRWQSLRSRPGKLTSLTRTPSTLSSITTSNGVQGLALKLTSKTLTNITFVNALIPDESVALFLVNTHYLFTYFSKNVSKLRIDWVNLKIFDVKNCNVNCFAVVCHQFIFHLFNRFSSLSDGITFWKACRTRTSSGSPSSTHS